MLKLKGMLAAASHTADGSNTGSDIRGRYVIESDPLRSTHRYPNPDPFIFDYLTRFWFCFFLSNTAPQ